MGISLFMGPKGDLGLSEMNQWEKGQSWGENQGQIRWHQRLFRSNCNGKLSESIKQGNWCAQIYSVGEREPLYCHQENDIKGVRAKEEKWEQL